MVFRIAGSETFGAALKNNAAIACSRVTYKHMFSREIVALRLFTTKLSGSKCMSFVTTIGLPWLSRIKDKVYSRANTFASYSYVQKKNPLSAILFFIYLSGIVGIILLSMVAFKFFNYAKWSTRGIEKLDMEQYGRRNCVFCRYKGYVYFSSNINTIVNDVPFFQVMEDDVWLVSYPKAGVTWLQELVYLIGTELDFKSARMKNIDERFPYLEYPFPGLKMLACYSRPRFIKTHLPFSQLPKQIWVKKPKVIYIARNPKDTVVSLMAFTNLLNNVTFNGSMDDFAELFVDGKSMYGPWAKHVLGGWSHRQDSNVLFVTYEQLQKDFDGTVRTVATFLGKDISEDSLRQLKCHCSFDNMKSNPSVNYSWQHSNGVWKAGNFFRKGIVGDWKNHLSPGIVNKLDTLMVDVKAAGLQMEDK